MRHNRPSPSIRTLLRRITLLFPGLLLVPLAGDLGAREIAGWVEQATLLPAGIQMKARLDTGAKNSSINAKEIDFFTRMGRRWCVSRSRTRPVTASN